MGVNLGLSLLEKDTDWVRVTEKRATRRRERKWHEAGENCILRNVIVCTLHKILLGWPIKDDEIRGKQDAWERREKHTKFYWENLKHRDGRIILKWILNKQDMTAWTWYIWLRKRTTSRLLWMNFSNPGKVGIFLTSWPIISIMTPIHVATYSDPLKADCSERLFPILEVQLVNRTLHKR